MYIYHTSSRHVKFITFFNLVSLVAAIQSQNIYHGEFEEVLKPHEIIRTKPKSRIYYFEDLRKCFSAFE